MRFILGIGFALSLLSGLAGGALAAEPLSRPDWSAIFRPDGTLIDLQGGVDAVFLEDKISDGLGIDMSALIPAPVLTVDNGTVRPEQDLGNAYVYARVDVDGNLQLYAGVERMMSELQSRVTFEFNQEPVGVYSGVPWPITGNRTAGDISVTVDLLGNLVTSATFLLWDGGSYQRLAIVGADGCSGADYLVCAGTPPQETVRAGVWDSTGQPVAVPAPDGFVEIGVNVGAVLGVTPEFTSIQMRTPSDVVLGSFGRMGFWANRVAGGQ
jgi:hypothetical protein